MAVPHTHPEPYDFLIAAGAIDRNDQRSPALQRASDALLQLSRMNGTYRTLNASFRADMRLALEGRDDAHVKRICETIARNCARLATLRGPDRVVLRRRFSRLSHYWPEQPETVLPSSS